METCPFCGKIGKSVKYHIWRMHGEGKDHDPNPNRGYEHNSRVAWNKGKTKESDIRILAASLKLKESFKDRELKGCCSKEYFNSPEHKMNSSKGGGYRENAGRSKKFSVYDTQGKRTTLQSTYEHAVFEILCELGIRWSRPKALKYSGKNYFADFHLLDYDIYLDPKNDYKAELDKEKINAVIEQNKVKLFVLLKEQITLKFISKLVS